MKRRCLSILIIQSLLLITLSGVYAQPKRLQFVQLTPDDGLSSSIASCIIQDHKGLMWIGTTDGLDRYDGFKFVVYRNVPGDSTSLANNVINTIFEDHNKNLLIGTEDGLSFYDRGKDRFLNYAIDKSSPLKGINCTVSGIIEDSKGNLWLATNVGLIYFDRMKNKITNYVHDQKNQASLSNDDVESVLTDKTGRLWVATRKGLNLFLPESGTFKCIGNENAGAGDLQNRIFLNIAEDLEGNIWFGSTEGLYCLKSGSEPATTNLIHYRHSVNDKSSLSIDLVRSLYIDKSGNLWIGTDNGGINLFNKEKQSFWHYRKDDYDLQSLRNEAIESICQDKSGNLWFGTYTGGINIAVSNRDAIIKYQNLPGAPLSLSHNTVTCFSEDNAGKILVGTDGGGLNIFDMKINRFRRFNLDNSSLTSNAVLCVLEDSRKRIWLGTWAGGLVKFDIRSGSFTSFTPKNSGIPDDNIYAVAEGYNDDLWIGTFEHGLIHYGIRENKITSLTPENSGLSNQMIIKIVKFPDRRLLIGTMRGFQIFSPLTNQFITYTSDPYNMNSLSSSRITDLLVENDTCIWIGTPDGLNKFNPVTKSFRRYYEKDGLSSNFIKALISDNSGALWVTTNNGVSRFDFKENKFRNFTKNDGFQSNEFSERSILKTKEGVLLMGGTKGFNLVYPEKISENKNIPDILITDFKIFNKSVKPGDNNSILSDNITETKSLTLSHELSGLTFSFAVMDFSAPEKNQYAYKMENFDKDWIYPDKKGEAVYTNLNPGKYVFHVRGTNNDGLWNETGTSISITILPAWWNTWWFRMVVIFSLILIIAAIFLLRVRQLKKQKIILEKTVAKKTEELKELNASKDKFFSIIAHDLKNPFSTLIGISEMLNEETDSSLTAKARQYANMINTTAVQTFKLLENLLEWANSQRGKILFKPGPINLPELINEELIMLNEMAVKKNIEVKTSIAEGIIIIIGDRNMIKTIMRNLLSNAVKFTHKNGTVEVSAIAGNDQVEISVADTGIGMTKETKERLFRLDANLSTRGTEDEKGTGLGLFLCKEFVEKHGGRIWVESEYGKGSTFRFVLPCSPDN